MGRAQDSTLLFKCFDIEQKRTKKQDISKRKFDISKYLFIISLIEQFIYGKIVTMTSRIGEIYDKSYIDGDQENEEVVYMSVSYNGLWKLLIDKNMKKVDLINDLGISSSTIAKMTKGEKVSMNILEKICDELDCDFGDIIHYEKK